MTQRNTASLRGAWDQVSMYLPLALMGGLALVTYWLVQTMPAAVSPKAPPPANEPSYQLHQVASRFYAPDGRLATELSGQALTHRPQLGGWVLTQAHLVHTDEAQTQLTASSQRLINDEAQNSWLLSGHAHVSSQASQGPRTDIRTEVLRIDTRDNRVTSERPVVIQQAGKRLEGERLSFEPRSGQMHLTGRVRGVWPGSPP